MKADPNSTSFARGRADHARGLRRIVVSIDIETFDQIRARADREGHSWAQSIRELIEWGLEDDNAQ